jgi:hypothetical protein
MLLSYCCKHLEDLFIVSVCSKLGTVYIFTGVPYACRNYKEV